MSDTEEPTKNPEPQTTQPSRYPIDRSPERLPPWRRGPRKRAGELADDEPTTLSFRMTGKDLRRINFVTDYLNISKSKFFREAIEKLLEQEEEYIQSEIKKDQGVRH